jgi:hypothetical protein
MSKHAFQSLCKPATGTPLRVPQYGMRWSTINYFQQQGRYLWHTQGVVPSGAIGSANVMRRLDGREIAHRVIALAAVRPEMVRSLLTGDLDLAAMAGLSPWKVRGAK